MSNLKKLITLALILAIASLAGGVVLVLMINKQAAAETTVLDKSMQKSELAEAVSQINSWTIDIYNDWYSEMEIDGVTYVDDWQTNATLYYNKTEKLAYIIEDFKVRDKDTERKGDYSQHNGFWTEKGFYQKDDYHFREYKKTMEWTASYYGGKNIAWFDTFSGNDCEGYDENGITVRAMNCIKRALEDDVENVLTTYDGYYLYRGVYPFCVEKADYWYDIKFKIDEDGKIVFTATTVEFTDSYMNKLGFTNATVKFGGTIYDFNKTSVQAYYDEFSEEFAKADVNSTLD